MKKSEISAKRKKQRREKAEQNNDLFRDDSKYKNKKLKVTLPIAPSVNNLFITKRNGRKILTEKARRYVLFSSNLIKEACKKQKWKIEDGDVWYYLDMVVYMPDRKIRDSHNMLKLMLDVFQEIAYNNDYWVMPRIQGVELDVENPRIDITIRPQTKKDREKNWL